MVSCYDIMLKVHKEKKIVIIIHNVDNNLDSLAKLSYTDCMVK